MQSEGGKRLPARSQFGLGCCETIACELLRSAHVGVFIWLVGRWFGHFCLFLDLGAFLLA